MSKTIQEIDDEVMHLDRLRSIYEPLRSGDRQNMREAERQFRQSILADSVNARMFLRKVQEADEKLKEEHRELDELYRLRASRPHLDWWYDAWIHYHEALREKWKAEVRKFNYYHRRCLGYAIKEIDTIEIKRVPLSHVWQTEWENGGSHRKKTLCPFHNENTPSFVWYTETNTWYCFGCGKHGDNIAFVMYKEGMNFPKAAGLLQSLL